MITALASVSAQRLVHLSPVDLAIIIFYFALVLAIGFYLKQLANTSEDHLMTSHEIIFACICALLQIKTNRQNEREIENNNGQVNRRKMDEPLGDHRTKGGNHGRTGRSPLIG